MIGENRFRRLVSTDNLSEGIKRRSVRSGAVAMISEGIDFLLRVGSIAILARLLIPEHFGLLAMVTAITTIAERLKDLGLSAATVQRPEINHAQISTLFWVNAAVGFGLMVLVMASAYPIAMFYNEPRLIPITLTIAVGLLWSGACIQHQALLRRTMRFRALAVIQISASLLSIVLAVIAAMRGFEYWALVLREVSRNVFVALGSWILMPWVPGKPSHQAGVGAMLRFGGNLTGFFLLRYMSVSVGQILIGKLFGAHSLAFYRQGQALVLAPVQQLSGPVTSVADAALCRLQSETEKYRHYYSRLLLLMSMTTVPLVAILAIFAEEIVVVVLGSGWIEAAPIFRILAIAVLLSPTLMTAGTVATTCGYAGRFLWLGVAESTALITLFFIGIPWGPQGIASAHIWAFCILAGPWIYWCLKGTPVDVRLFLRTISRPVAASIIMSVAILAMQRAELTQNPIATLALGLPAAAIAYLLGWLVLPGGRLTLLRIVMEVREALGSDRHPQS